MRLFVYIFIIVLFSTNVYAIESFVANCESGKAHRYDNGNGLDMGGNIIPNQSQGWMTENWWGKDDIIWDGGKELTLNYGQMKATIIENNDDVISAIYSDMNNVYLLLIDTKLGMGILSQQQNVVLSKHRRIMSRTIGLKCKLTDK
jgi:hypothetical protein